MKNASILLIASLAAVMLVAGCTGYDQGSATNGQPSQEPTQPSTSSNQPTVPSYTVKTSSKQGISSYLVDANGMTLYYFTRDTQGTASSGSISTCTGSCTDIWPVFYAGTVSVPSNLNANNFGSLDRGSGVMQTTYKGWPLYYYYLDNATGDTKGHSVNGVWFLINPTAV